MSQKFDDLHYLVNRIYTLIDEGCDEDSSLEKVNDTLIADLGFEDDLYEYIEDYRKDFETFNKVADYFAIISQE